MNFKVERQKNQVKKNKLLVHFLLIMDNIKE